MIVDYKILLKETTNHPQDWNLALAVEYENHAALDRLAANGEGSARQDHGRQTAGPTARTKRQEIPEVIGSDLLQEIMLK